MGAEFLGLDRNNVPVKENDFLPDCLMSLFKVRRKIEWQRNDKLYKENESSVIFTIIF